MFKIIQKYKKAKHTEKHLNILGVKYYKNILNWYYFNVIIFNEGVRL
jgi:hypothetical protein